MPPRPLSRRRGPHALVDPLLDPLVGALFAAFALGCAAPGSELPPVRAEIGRAPAALGQDARAAYADWHTWAYLGAGGALAIVTEQSFVEDRIEDAHDQRAYLDRHFGQFLDSAGNGLWVYAAAGLEYAYARANGDLELHEDSKRTLRALTLTGLSTLALKALVSDARPDTGQLNGFPSGHASMSMALAVSVDESFGWQWGLPFYLTSALVGVQRLDSGRHDLDDVVFGWTLGYVLARSVWSAPSPGAASELTIAPFVEAQQEVVGLALRYSF